VFYTLRSFLTAHHSWLQTDSNPSPLPFLPYVCIPHWMERLLFVVVVYPLLNVPLMQVSSLVLFLCVSLWSRIVSLYVCGDLLFDSASSYFFLTADVPVYMAVCVGVCMRLSMKWLSYQPRSRENTFRELFFFSFGFFFFCCLFTCVPECVYICGQPGKKKKKKKPLG
jgi:hypothetical protein